jgi:hypothetical protein
VQSLLLHLITFRHTTLGRIPLDEGSASLRDLYLTTQHSRQTFMPPAGFESAIPERKQPQTHALTVLLLGSACFLSPMYKHSQTRTQTAQLMFSPSEVWPSSSSFLRFLDHTQRRTTVGRTPLDEWSARRRDLYLTAQNTHNRQTSMPRLDSNPRSQQASGRRPTP